MAIVTLVNYWEADVNSGSNTSLTVSRNQAYSKGDVLIAAIIGSATPANITSVTDNQFGTFTSEAAWRLWDSAHGWSLSHWAAVATSSGSGASNTTVSVSPAQSIIRLIVAQFTCAAGYSFAPTASVIMAGVSQAQTHPGTGAGAITSGSTNFGSVPAFAFGSCIDITGTTTFTPANAGWTSGFTGSYGYWKPEYSDIGVTGYQAATYTDASNDDYLTVLSGLLVVATTASTCSYMQTYAMR